MWKIYSLGWTKIISETFGAFKNIPFLPILLDEQMKIFTLFFRPKVFSDMIDLTARIKKIEGIKTSYHKYGGMEFRLQNKEVCHIHGDGLVDVRPGKALKEEFIGKPGMEPHHVMPDSDMISYQLSGDGNTDLIQEIIAKACERIKAAD